MLYRDWLNLRSHLLWCYDHEIIPAREDASVHRRDTFVNSGAWLVRSGWAMVEYEEQGTLRAEPGQWLVVRPGERTQSFATDTHLLSVAFEAKWPDGEHLLKDGLPLLLDSVQHPELERKAKPMARLMKNISGALWDVRQQPVNDQQFFKIERHLSEWVRVLLVALTEAGVEPMLRDNIDERVTEVVNLLFAHPIGAPLDLKELAASVGLSVVHLNRLFQREMGTTPRRFFENRRIEYATDCLRMSDVRIKEVALTLGFIHLSHFSKWFKSSSGRSPREFVRNAATTKLL